ncbi:MAG TPA: Rieske 2Fe-2S domain-containing protein [Herbaspirillum sp.]|jgi:phenylpropionate dioxygenase-like ring-hydroxylating dioxygenase large terminal subunit
MMKKEQNDLLTQTGPGTQMGNLFRRYWLPALLSEELPGPDCPPVRVELLSERLIAFRDTDGKLGLIDEFCAHRGVSLWFGRNEESGLRCPYHGWKYDTTGQCVDVPSEPPEGGYCKKIKLTSYPLIELGGVLWTYMGPPEHQPAPPAFEFTEMPESHRFMSKRLQESNYLQAMEGGIDSSHVSFLHRGNLESDPLFKGAKGNQYNLGDFAPVFEVVESEAGLYIGARRKAEAGNYYWRITPWVMPCFTMIPPRAEYSLHGHFWVPINDENCWVWTYDYHPTRALTDDERQAMKDGYGPHAKMVPNAYVTVQNKRNDYLMDRNAQKNGESYSGIEGFGMQDSSIQESMGAIQDRTKENLVATDNGIHMARKRLLRAAKALAENGTSPPATNPELHKVRSVAIVLPPDVPFPQGAKEDLRARAGVPPCSV